MSNLLRQCLRLLGAERGAAAIEFAILAPVMLLILVGAGDFGLSVHSKLQLQAAANAGLQHAIATQGKEIARTQAVITHELGGAPATIKVGGTSTDTGSSGNNGNGNGNGGGGGNGKNG